MTAVDQTLAQLPQNLNFENPIFGIVTSGFDILNKLMSTPTDSNDRPTTNEVINSATVFTDTNDGVIELQSAAGFTGSTTISITANDGNGSTSQQSANINVVADTVNDPPFLGTVGNQVTNEGTPVTFTVQGIDLQDNPLTFIVADPTSFTTNGGTASEPANVNVSISVAPASGSNPSTATITLTPDAGFSGTIDMVVSDRDDFVSPTAPHRLIAPAWIRQDITLTVNFVNQAPTTPGGSISTPINQAVSIQLTASTGNPNQSQTLTYILVGQPADGTISNFNASTGALEYTPNNNFVGNDSFTYQVQNSGGTANGGHDTSAVATFSITVGAFPDISGSWVINGLLTMIQESGAALTFTNERGQQSAGGFISATQIQAIGWVDMTGTLANNNAEIDWSNGTVWTKGPTSVANISGSWVFDGLVTTIQETTALILRTRKASKRGVVSFRRPRSRRSVGANSTGNSTNSNSGYRLVERKRVRTQGPTSVPNISGSWIINGLVTTIQRPGRT